METNQIEVTIGNITLGPGQPVLIQSMCNTPSGNTTASVEQCIRIFEAGGGLVRLTARNQEEARNLGKIKYELESRGYLQPICADVHFNPAVARTAAALVDKVRINPGNFSRDKVETPFLDLLETCRKHGTALRIGVNHGSLSGRIMEEYGDTPGGMVESALEYLRVCRREGFHDVVVSLKSSNTRIMVYANRLMKERMEEEQIRAAMHLGVTEAGAGEEGRIRSATGIGTLLNEGMGDTLRVSLTEEPEHEIPVAKKLLAVTGDWRGKPGTHCKTEYGRRPSKAFGILGGDQVPAVLGTAVKDEKGNGSTAVEPDLQPDFLFRPDHRLQEDYDSVKKYLMTAESWMKDSYPHEHFFPLFDLAEFRTRSSQSPILNFILAGPDELAEASGAIVGSGLPCCLVYLHDGKPSSREAFKKMAEDNGFTFPLLVRAVYPDGDPELFQIRAAAELAWYFLDGYADGIWLDNPFAGSSLPASLPVSTSFKILQACRARMTETEYIACPSCGRTLFNLQDTLAGIRQATSHLRNLKIAVMGCIVNGPGEMADADYGYVGSGKGRVNLYRKKMLIKKGIREEDAVRELVNLIREYGDWTD
jgi:(E)-4-hydroxy-3-methylbut-2-enyl-diphosphate synthase